MKKIKVIIIRTAGTNCDYELKSAFELCGATVDRVHINELISSKNKILSYGKRLCMSYKLSNFAYTNNVPFIVVDESLLCMSYKLSNFAYTNNFNVIKSKKKWLCMSYKLSNFAYTNNPTKTSYACNLLCMSYKLSNFAYTNNTKKKS